MKRFTFNTIGLFTCIICCLVAISCTKESSSYLLTRPGDHVYFSFTGTSVSIDLEGIVVNENENSWIYVTIDDCEPLHLEVQHGGQILPVANNLNDGTHTIEITKVTELHPGKVKINKLLVDDNAEYQHIEPTAKLHIHYVGDSTTCGYGIDADNENDHFSPETENFCHTYCYLVAKELKAEWSVEATSGIGLVNNGPYVPEEQPTMSQSYPFDDFSPDYICINVGVNDIPNPKHKRSEWISGYRKFINDLHGHYPSATIICMCGPMFPTKEEGEQTDDEKHAEMIQEAISNIAIPNVKFLMLQSKDDVGFGADWHPSVGQNKYAAEQLSTFIQSLKNN